MLLNQVITKLQPKLLLIAASSTLVLSFTTTALAAIYKTNSNQVVVTGLKPHTKYPVQTTSFSGRGSTRTVMTNSCGEALISNGTGYRRLSINARTITPASMPMQTHPRCHIRRNRTVNNSQQPVNR